jgi:hypothetical protein
MALTQVTGPYPIFTDLDGTPLDDGYLYIGEVNQDPETNPIQVYWDSNLTIPASQPIRTSNGYAYRNGTPALLYTAGEFSITIRNKREEFVLYSPVGYGFDPAAVSASVTKNDFIGDGVEVDFVLSAAPSTILATNVFINGVYQEKDSYSILGNVLTFSIAPPLSSSIEVLTNQTGVINTGYASDITYIAGFAGAVTQTVQTKLEQTVSVEDFGAVGDGVTDDSAAIQAAVDYAAATGSRIILFPQGKNTDNGTSYNLGSTTITIPSGEMKLVGQKYTQIRKTGAGAFFDIAALGYGFEAEGLWLVGSNVDNQIGFLFSGEFNGSYMQGVLQGNIHDCWFEAVGKKETVDKTAGGAILVTSQSLGLRVADNICSQGGYLLRVEVASDNVTVTHNVTNISRSVAVQFEDTAGAASCEVSNNNLANVGGGVFLKNAGYVNVFGNACIPGESEAGALGAVVKRTVTAGEVFLAEDVATGISATIWADNTQTPSISNNVCSFAGAAQDSDYGIYLSSRQSTCFVSNNFVVGHLIAGLFVWPGQPQILTNNRSSNAQKDTVYSDPLHPSITHNYTLVTPSFQNYHGWGTAIAGGPYEFCSPGSAATNGFVQLRVSNSSDRNEYIGFGWDDTGSVGYIQAYKTGVGYQAIRHRSSSLFLGQTDTSVVIQASSGQGSNLLRVTDNANTANYIQVGPTGSITLNIPSTFADNAAALAGGLTVGRLYKTATGDVKVVY